MATVPTIFHKNLPPASRHAPHSWEVADDTARLAITVTSDDVNKTLVQGVGSSSVVYRAIAAGTGSSVWKLETTTSTTGYTDAQAIAQANLAIISQKGVADGIASLGSDNLVPAVNLPVYAANILTSSQVSNIAAGNTRHSTIVIAASDTIGKAGADIVCTAGNAFAQIQAAITSMRGKPGRIFFLDGTYDIEDEFIVDTSWLTLEGESHGMWGNYTSTIANFAKFPRASAPPARSGALFRQNTAGKGVWRVGTNYLDSGTRHKALNWLRLNHYGPSGTGIVLRDDSTAMTDICRFASCNIQGFGAGVDVRWDNPMIFDNNIQDTGGGAANSTLAPAAIRVRGVRGQIYDNVVFQVGGVGIWAGSYGASVHNNVVGGTNDHNIFVTAAKVKVIGNDCCNPGSSQAGGNSTDNICIGNYPETGANANYFTTKAAEGCVIMGNTCSMVMEDNNAFPVNNTGSCITVGDGGIPALTGATNRTVVHGNTCYSSATSIAAGIYAIDVKNASTECSVTGNTISGVWNANGTVKVGNLGTNAANNIVKDNPGSA